MFNKQVVRSVARAVEEAAHQSGTAMRSHRAHTSNRKGLNEIEPKIPDTQDLYAKAESQQEKS